MIPLTLPQLSYSVNGTAGPVCAIRYGQVSEVSPTLK